MAACDQPLVCWNLGVMVSRTAVDQQCMCSSWHASCLQQQAGIGSQSWDKYMMVLIMLLLMPTPVLLLHPSHIVHAVRCPLMVATGSRCFVRLYNIPDHMLVVAYSMLPLPLLMVYLMHVSAVWRQHDRHA
jgi:hypothetical protein